MTRDELMQCSCADILLCNPENLANLKNIRIPDTLPVTMRFESFLEQVHNPYQFRIDDLIVRVSFSGTKDFSSALAGLIANG